MSTPVLYYAFDSVLRRWEDVLRDSPGRYDVETWSLDKFLSDVFHGWAVVNCLWHENSAAAVVRNDEGVYIALPFYWAERYLSDTPTEPGDDEWGGYDEDDETEGRSYANGARESCFDLAMTDSVTATEPEGLIHSLLEETSVYQSDATLYAPPRTSVLLAVEACLLAAPVEEQAGMRVLLGLQNVAQAEGYRHLS